MVEADGKDGIIKEIERKAKKERELMTKMGKDYETNKNYNIPLLEYCNSKKFDFVTINYLESDSISSCFNDYKILDIFDTQLEENDEKIKYLNNDYFRLSQEIKYINFAKSVFDINNNECYLITHMFAKCKNYDYGYILQLLDGTNGLDLLDKHIILEQFFQFKNSNKKLFRINNINLLLTFLKMNLREIGNNTIVFEQKPMILKGGHDLSLPIWIKQDNIKIYKKLISEEKLYLR